MDQSELKALLQIMDAAQKQELLAVLRAVTACSECNPEFLLASPAAIG